MDTFWQSLMVLVAGPVGYVGICFGLVGAI
jgi:hypothetical protein